MKGSSSFAHARRLTVAILILLLASAGEMAEDEQIFGNGESVSPPETEEEGLRMDHQLPSGTGGIREADLVGHTPSPQENESDPIAHKAVEMDRSNGSAADALDQAGFCLSGHTYWDKNQNGKPDPYEERLRGWIITIRGESDAWRTSTNVNGYWKICNLTAGTYYISESAPVGDIGWISSRRPAKVTIESRSIKDLDSGNYRALHDEPLQYEQFCESQLVEGSGYLDLKTSVLDKKLAMDYQNRIFGEGDIGLESAQAYSQEPNKLTRPIKNCSDPNGTTLQKLNFFENTKLVYAGPTPLVGSRSIRSLERYGGIGADIHENFSARRMEADQTMFLAQTSNSTIRRTVGSNTQNSFEGMWGTESSLHKTFYSDIKRREKFAGEFEIQRELKFHEKPAAEPKICPCGGVDC